MFGRPWLRALCPTALVLSLVLATPTAAAAGGVQAGARVLTASGPSPSPAPPDQSQPSTGPGAAAPAPSSTPQGTSQAAATAATSNADLTREVFGYAQSGILGDPNFGYPSWNFNLLSTVAFFAINVNYNGTLNTTDSSWAVWNSSTLTGLVNTAHAHGVKVVIGIKAPPDLVDFCDALYNGQTTANALVAEVKAKGVDGVNIDYESQLNQCYNNDPTLDATNQTLLTKFAATMRATLDAAKPGYYLSIATYSGSAGGTDGFFNIPDLNKYVDAFFVMAYDMDEASQGVPPLNCGGSFCMGSVSPYAGYEWNDSLSMSQYTAVVGPGKTILGQPYYGRVACVNAAVPHAIPTGPVVAATYTDAASVESSPDVQPGTFAAHRDADDPTGLDRWDTWYDLKLGCTREMYWSDTTTLGQRYDYANQLNLRGVGFWTLNYGGGASELWTALQNHFVACTAAGVSTAPAPPQIAGTSVAVTASSKRCVHPQYQFWLAAPGGGWQLVQPYSPSPTFTWATQGATAGVYGLSVWVRDASSAGVGANNDGSWDAYTSTQYQLKPGQCTGVALSTSPLSPAIAGPSVTVTGTPTWCPNPNPLYQFWVAAPGGSWQIAQPYSTSATFAWDTSKAVAGTYGLSVWIRDANSPGLYANNSGRWDAYASAGFNLNPQKCSSVTLTPSPVPPSAASTTVTLTAAAAGCTNPLYQFWMAAPGGAWRVVQAYSTKPTFAWNTPPGAAGSYSLSVWVMDASGSGAFGNASGRWDAFTSSQYALTTSPCTSVTLSASPASSSPAGTTVTLTAIPSGCPSAQYEFWMAAPGGGWKIVQPYSGTATYTWVTTVANVGTYSISVWVRDTSSNGTSGNSTGRWDAYTSGTYTLH